LTLCDIVHFKWVILIQGVNGVNTDTSRTLEQAASYPRLLPII